MPKKTKKQKLLAELHKKLSAATVNPTPVNSQIYSIPSSTTVKTATNISFNNYTVAKPKTLISLSDYSYITTDLIRITIFTIIAFILQGVLYFQLHRS